MFIPLPQLKEKYGLVPENILHVGAHEAQELDDYMACGARKIHWVEANTELAGRLSGRLDPTVNRVTNAVVSDADDREVVFRIANNTQSSSILDLGEHSQLFPGIRYTSEEKRLTRTLDAILEEERFLPHIDFLNIDIQGAELLALNGIVRHIGSVRSIYVEVNDSEVYVGCSLTSDIDCFLSEFGFGRVEKRMYSNHPWGDAFYIRG